MIDLVGDGYLRVGPKNMILEFPLVALGRLLD
jgi:hypothetical protein